MGAMKVWDGSSWQTVAPFSERASVYVGPSAPAGATYAGDLWWDTDEPSLTLPGQELAYGQLTTNVSVTATTEAAANTIVTAPAVTFDGAMPAIIEFFTPQVNTPGPSGSYVVLALFQDGVSIGQMAVVLAAGTGAAISIPVHSRRRLTPTAGSHTYSVRAFSVNATGGVIVGGVGASGAYVPAFIRATRV